MTTYATNTINIHILVSFIHNSLSHSQLKRYLFHKSYPPIVSLLALGLPSRTIARNVSSELLGFCFSLFFLCHALD